MSKAELARLMLQWRLEADGAPFRTSTSLLAPVRRDGAAAMLKLPEGDDEAGGAAALAWFGGEGAVRLLAVEGTAQLMERAEGDLLVTRVAAGKDDEASAVIGETLTRLHAPRPGPLPSLTPLPHRLRSLFAAPDEGPVGRAQRQARCLLADAPPAVVLHGDLHHENIVHDRERGWLAIDPKGLIGERTYDYANSLANPVSLPQIVLQPGRLPRQAAILAQTGGLELDRLMRWVFVHAALAACWSREAGQDDRHWLAVAELACP